MTVDAFLATNPPRDQIAGALWAETALTPVLTALDRIKLQRALEALK